VPPSPLPGRDSRPPSLPFQATAQGLRDIFYRMGFDDKEIVALSGAHALGRCHPDASGYDGPWTPTPTSFNNGYFALLTGLTWTKRAWDGPDQFEDPSKRLMMLPSDLVLLEDKSFAKYVALYAKDAKAFDADFAAAFQKLEELGTAGLSPVAL
jgi:cytochrome c peroxidase